MKSDGLRNLDEYVSTHGGHGNKKKIQQEIHGCNL